MSTIIRGKELAQTLREKTARAVEAYHLKTHKRPGLAVIQVGEDPASTVYVNNKEKACQAAGIRSSVHRLSRDSSQLELMALIEQLNRDESIHGILCQLPLPDQFDAFTATAAIKPEKDVDGFHPLNAGLLFLGREAPVPCTPLGVLAMLKAYKIPIAGQHCVIVGRSNIVGKPMAQLMLRENATVTTAHSRTQNLPELCRQADILIAAVGRARMITADFIKPGATVIDVGVNRCSDGKLAGDVDFESVSTVAGAITPVPGGVGPMTIAMLLQNTLDAFLRIEKLTGEV
ncbi:MAG: bifunctional methylenetetrahydrofolate dehydrogenase/methenyltetrahydrofolate cyclohydrolase FolD [Clostridiaceae bacterium]|nr:bifunctional methylenetetrahydrofolate dehydrogenase/methenyltetrahydrofolate cyclohydrolase FolD [Clostridiaceae bacterium]